MLIYVDPQAIQNFLRFKKRKVIAIYDDFELNARRYKKRRFAGLIVQDKAVKKGRKLMQCSHFEGTVQRFAQNMDWRDTNYLRLHETWYQKINGRKHKGKSFEEFYNHRLKKWDHIFNEIKTKGYKKSEKNLDNVEVAIDKNGQFFLIDGRHRVAFAQIAGIKQIPVNVNVISESFAQSLADENFAKSFADRHLAVSFSDNRSRLSRQLDKEDIKDRLAIACKHKQKNQTSKSTRVLHQQSPEIDPPINANQ